MVFRILAARGALALEDTSGACGDCGPVDGPSGVDDGLHRFDAMAANPHSAATTRMSSSHTRTDARKPSADGIGTIGSRPAKPAAFSTPPFPWPEYGSRNRGPNP